MSTFLGPSVPAQSGSESSSESVSGVSGPSAGGGGRSKVPAPTPEGAALAEEMPMTDESQKQWSEIQSTGTIPIGRIGHSICHDGKGNLYLWGGVNDGVEGKYLSDFFKYVIFVCVCVCF